MVALSDSLYMTPEEYLNWEKEQEIKYEYYQGQIIAMTGGTINHGLITGNLFYQIKNHLKGKPCLPFIFDVKLGIEKNNFHYPDLMVTCDERDRKETKIIYHPCLIIEVLSPSTESFDRGKKFQNYRQIDTLKEYVLISTEEKIIECFRLNEKGIWELYTYIDNLELKSINFSCSLTLIYEDVNLENKNYK